MSRRKKMTPEHFIPLAELARMARSKANVLRKHRVGKWLAAGLAHKDPAGMWWVDPDLLPTVKAVRSRVQGSELEAEKPDVAAIESALSDVSASNAITAQLVELSAEEVRELLKPLEGRDPTRIAAAMINLLALERVPWEVVIELGRIGQAQEGPPRALIHSPGQHDDDGFAPTPITGGHLQ